VINRPLTDAEVNHLRKLLGWIDCEIGQAPDDMVNTVKGVAAKIGEIDKEGQARLVEAHNKSASVPQYVRAAIKALKKTLVKVDGEVLDVDSTRTVQHIEN
jgi:hypothetical protein